MDFYGGSRDDDGATPPAKRPARKIFTDPNSSMASPTGQRGGKFLDLEAIDLNLEAPNWPNLTNVLQSASFPNFGEAEVGRSHCSPGVHQPVNHTSHPVAQPHRRRSCSADAVTMGAKPFRAPRTAGANTRNARRGHRGAAVLGRNSKSALAAQSGGSRGTHGNVPGSAHIGWMPSMGGAAGPQDFDDEGLGDASANNNMASTGEQWAAGTSDGSARRPVLLPDESCSRGKSRKRVSTAWTDSMPTLGLDEDAEEGFGDGSSTNSSSSDEGDEKMKFVLQQSQVMQQYCAIACMFGMYHFDTYMSKSIRRKPELPGHDWVMATLNNKTACFNMFWMSPEIFHRLHNLLVSSYGLRSSKKMTSVEALAMFLWIVGAPQSARQAENRFERSTETVSRKFKEVLDSVFRLSATIIKPKDPEFRTIHPRLRGARFAPYFDNCIGALDGTHVPVVVPTSKLLQYVGRHGYPSQNVLAICDFDMRFTFAVVGWPGSVHDMRVFNDAIRKYGDKFPHPPPGKFYVVDSGYPNRPGYLAPYKGTKYHLPEFRQGPGPIGKKEVFNFLHSSLRNVIEHSFGVLKMKWRILLDMPSYPEAKQSKIILACMALHNFIRESLLADADFDMCDRDENYMPMPDLSSHHRSSSRIGDEDHNMNDFRDKLADALFARRA